MITIESSGELKATTKFLEKIFGKMYIEGVLAPYAQEGVDALYEATPKRTGRTASSWNYEIESNSDGYIIHWYNTNVNRGVNIALILQEGHGTKQGAYVQGRDYINPAMQPIFDKIADEIWKEVTSDE